MSYRYLGNKTRIADWITGVVIDSVPAGSVIADLMCGTAAMSAAFARAGYAVIAADQLRYPLLHAQARLLNGRARFEAFGFDYEEAVAVLNRLPTRTGFFWREYSDEGRPSNGARPRRYFTGANAARIDAVRDAIWTWRAQGLDSLAANLLLHDLILAANRVANIAGTYGFYRSQFSAASLAPIVLVPTGSGHTEGRHSVWQGKVEDTIGAVQAEAIYLDPPYTKRQYGGNYHILETLALEDEPEPVGEGGLRDWYEQASDFCYRRRAPRAFQAVLDGCKANWVFISYSEDAHLSSDELCELLTGYGGVSRYEKPIERFRSNARVARQGNVREHLYVLEMKNVGAAKPSRALDKEAQSVRALQH